MQWMTKMIADSQLQRAGRDVGYGVIRHTEHAHGIAVHGIGTSLMHQLADGAIESGQIPSQSKFSTMQN